MTENADISNDVVERRHDPMCLEPLSLEEREIVSATIEPVYCDVCIAIAKARADEREKAAQRVESCVNKFKARDFNDAVDACAAAVRGES